MKIHRQVGAPSDNIDPCPIELKEAPRVKIIHGWDKDISIIYFTPF